MIHVEDRETPEHNLWFSVLHMYFVDIDNVRRRPDQIKTLYVMACSSWTRRICDLIGIEHVWFCEQVKKRIDLRAETREKYYLEKLKLHNLKNLS